jgi:ElaB/YqjD/DUF883 family membrane-anchored ribosome-binding protein
MTQAANRPGQQDGLKDQAAEKMHDAASAAEEKASEIREQGSLKLRDQFDQRSNAAGSQVRSLAEALRASGKQLNEQGNSGGARLAGQAADQVERVGRYLEQKSGDELMHDIEVFTRRRPWMLAGLGMLIGIAGARVVKASSDQRYANYRRASEGWPTRQALTPSAELEASNSEAFTSAVDDPAERNLQPART